ncbi:MAG: pyridoxal phosphate-dependent aminotransferase [Polyangiaceae bacterium]
MKLSRRTGWPRRPSRLAELLASAKGPRTDLTASNPTSVGLARPEVLPLLAAPEGARYRPEALGRREAREAVARYYARRGASVDADQVVLTASSSEAYAWLFKLLADPGDTVLAPEPSYPLFPFLAGLEDVRLVPYPLRKDEAWRIDLGAVARRLDEEPRARAILVVHPGNPTGALLRQDDALALGELAAARDVALVVDEVFLDYPDPRVAPNRRGTTLGLAAETGADVFVLSGLSKVALLPQVKLGWLVAEGPGAAEALARLEIVADSYLSVSAAVQLAAPRLLDEVEPVQARLAARLAANGEVLQRALSALGPDAPVTALPRDGGWYVMLEVPRTRSDDEWIAHLLEAGLVVHPGYFFDAEEEGLMVVSLLVEPEVFAPAIARALALFAAG